jgi:dihydroxyacetone kinase-like protein
MKKLINAPEDVVRESAEGLAAAHADILELNASPLFLYRRDAPVRGKSALVSGGGSGHEPLHSGYVGMGMLDAACPGEIFTSPTPDQMLDAAKRVHGGGGVLNIVKNYSGDVMNFEMAAELLIAEGIETANVLIDDDVAVSDSLFTQGRRGVGTTVLAEKICGAAAEAGYDLKRLAELCTRVSSGGRSMGMALSSCILPARGIATFDLAGNEMELGIGIHGEPGRERRRLVSADEITELLARSIIDDPAYTRSLRVIDSRAAGWRDVEMIDAPLKRGDRVLVLVNGMGGTPLSELYIVYRKLHELCEREGIVIVRNLIGNYITSLEMQGCSITMLPMDEELVKLWDAPVHTPSLRWGG